MTVRRIVIFGRCAWDSWIVDGDVSREDGFGGTGGNLAVMLAQLGLDVRLVTNLGTDQISIDYLSRLRSLGVDTSYARRDKGPLSVCIIEPGVRYDWKYGHPGIPQFTKLRTQAALQGFWDAVVFSDIAPPERLAANSERRYWLPQLWLNDGKNPLGVLESDWSAVFLNRRETGQIMALSSLEIISLSRRFRDTSFVCTRDIEATNVYLAGRRREFPVFPTQVRVAIGGGDALAAGYIYGDLMGRDPASSLALGHQLASAVVQHVGCQLERHEILTILQRTEMADG